MYQMKKVAKFNDTYYEIYSLLTLKYYWDNYSPTFVKCECPDWISNIDSIGIEVTRAISESDGIFYSLANKKIPLKNIGKQKAFKGEFKDKYLSPTKSFESNKEKINVFKERYISKLEKLNKNYAVFNKNILYLFYDLMANENDINILFDEILKINNSYCKKFDLAFINCLNTIYLINFSNNNNKAISIKNHDLEKFKKYSLDLSQSIKKDDNFEAKFNEYLK
jgi:hypothetical protein